MSSAANMLSDGSGTGLYINLDPVYVAVAHVGDREVDNTESSQE